MKWVRHAVCGSTHLIVGSDDEVFLSHRGIPGHAARNSTLLNAVRAGQNNSIFLRLLQVILHLITTLIIYSFIYSFIYFFLTLDWLIGSFYQDVELQE